MEEFIDDGLLVEGTMEDIESAFAESVYEHFLSRFNAFEILWPSEDKKDAELFLKESICGKLLTAWPTMSKLIFDQSDYDILDECYVITRDRIPEDDEVDGFYAVDKYDVKYYLYDSDYWEENEDEIKLNIVQLPQDFFEKVEKMVKEMVYKK